MTPGVTPLLAGQTALVTGCGRLKGIGRGIALALACAGADVAITDVVPGGTRNRAEVTTPEDDAGWQGLPSLAAEIEALDRRSACLVGDVGVRADAERLVSAAVSALGRVDILVNNAAAPHGDDRNVSWKVPEEAWDEVLRVNTKGAFLMSTAVIRHLLDRDAPGRIVNIASIAARKGGAHRAAYAASKFAMIGMTQAMAQELAEYGITVNAVCPGETDTARGASRAGRATQSAEAAKGIVRPTPPVGRIGTAADVGRCVTFFADPAADFITGASVDVNGGVFMS
jgi:NAD(P)-dependent dehydrogenase (short-subunit alcohol dehydrogenase family)